MDPVLAEQDLREALVAFEDSCRVLLAAMRDGMDDVPDLLAEAETRLRVAQDRLRAVRLRNREARS